MPLPNFITLHLLISLTQNNKFLPPLDPGKSSLQWLKEYTRPSFILDAVTAHSGTWLHFIGTHTIFFVSRSQAGVLHPCHHGDHSRSHHRVIMPRQRHWRQVSLQETAVARVQQQPRLLIFPPSLYLSSASRPCQMLKGRSGELLSVCPKSRKLTREVTGWFPFLWGRLNFKQISPDVK